jgi:hypothetical protein
MTGNCRIVQHDLNKSADVHIIYWMNVVGESILVVEAQSVF